MKSRVWLWLLGVVVVVSATLFIAVQVGRNRSEAAFQEQLRLARQEGIPTSAAEFAARIKPVPPEQNGAQFYRELVKLRGELPKDPINYCPIRDASLARDKRFVASTVRLYNIIDEATKRPHCWFDRDWSQGYAVLFPEYAYIKNAAKLLMIRGSVEASEGNSIAAVRDVNELFAMGRHLDEDPAAIAYLVHIAVIQIAAQTVSTWSMEHRNEPAYKKLLQRAIEELPRPDLRRLYSAELYAMLSAIDMLSTPEGRRKFGLKDDDGPSLAQQAFLKMASQGKGKADIVMAYREAWAAFPKPMAQRDRLLQKADSDLDQALMAYPYAYSVIRALSGGHEPWDIDFEAVWITDRQRDIALERAISQDPIPHKIKTSDLLSPYDGKPLAYSFDGKQISITTSPEPSDDEDEPPKPMVRKTPPDSAFQD